jgi:pimeloyl-ACP methyl ester carboxylesterase
MINVPEQFSTDRVTINGTSICYYRTGGGKPPLVMAHGMTDMGLCWTHVANGLRHKYDVILYDARGHGQSDTSVDGHDPAQRAADLRGLLEALEIRAALLLGHSMGAMTVGLLAAKNPELARAVVLEDPPLPRSLIEPPDAEQLATSQSEWLRWKTEVVNNRKRKPEELVSSCRRQSPWWHESEVGPWVTSKLLVSPDVFNTPPLDTTDWWQCLTEITCPMLIISAEAGRGALISERAAGELKERLPESATFVRLPGAGHNIHREQFDRYMSLTTDFFARS